MSDKAYFGGGCFWCTEAVFNRLKGVAKVTPGYSGGTTTNPTYYRVSEGNTGHAEVIEVEFDATVISYEQLLDVFFHTHDPTTNQQPRTIDNGPEYRSIILYLNDQQKQQAETMKQHLKDSNEFGRPIITEIKAFTAFYPAEESHVQFYEKNPDSRYCQLVIDPKIEHFKRRFEQLLKE